MKPLLLSPSALDDLREIHDRIAAANPVRAKSFIAELRGKAIEAAARPLSFRRRPELGPDIRSIVHRRYLILFRERAEDVIILRFAHGARQLERLELD